MGEQYINMLEKMISYLKTIHSEYESIIPEIYAIDGLVVKLNSAVQQTTPDNASIISLIQKITGEIQKVTLAVPKIKNAFNALYKIFLQFIDEVSASDVIIPYTLKNL